MKKNTYNVYVFILIIIFYSCSKAKNNLPIYISAVETNYFGELFFEEEKSLVFKLHNNTDYTIYVDKALSYINEDAFKYKEGSFSGIGGTCEETLASNSTCSFEVCFAPQKEGFFSTNIVIVYGEDISSKDKELLFNIKGIGISEKVKYVLGSFKKFNNIQRSGVVRILDDGSMLSKFNKGVGTDKEVLTGKIDEEGRLIIGGTFTSYNKIGSNKIARINQDGSIDETFIVGEGFNFDVKNIDIDSLGRIVVGGSFTSYNGVTVNRLARLNQDGTLDETFNQAETGADNSVDYVFVDEYDNIFFSGFFTEFNGENVSSNSIVLSVLNNDGSFYQRNFGSSLGVVKKLILHSYLGSFAYPQYIAVGEFLLGSVYNIRKLTTLLTEDDKISNIEVVTGGSSLFNSGVGTDFSVLDGIIEEEGKLIIGGVFKQYSGTERKCIARLNVDGSIDESFNVNENICYIYSVNLDSNNNILVGGDFTNYAGKYNYLVKLNKSGEIDNSFGSFDAYTGPDNYVKLILTQ
jgi:uncharacterized delta-60 repeat protein